MPITRTSLRFRCSEADCPDPTNEDLHNDPPQCAEIAGHTCQGIPGERARRTHQHVPKRSQGGRQIAWWPCLLMNLSCDDGRAIDGGIRYGNSIVGGYVRVYNRDDDGVTLLLVPVAGGLGGVELDVAASGAPPLTPSVLDDWLTADWTNLSDDDLAANYQYGETEACHGLLKKCKAVHAYREKHLRALGETWMEGAYELFGASRRTLEGLAGMWSAAQNVTSDADQLAPIMESRSLVQHIGRQSHAGAAQALEAAIHHVAVFGEPPTVRQLASGNAGQEPEIDAARCKACGQRLPKGAGA